MKFELSPTSNCTPYVCELQEPQRFSKGPFAAKLETHIGENQILSGKRAVDSGSVSAQTGTYSLDIRTA